MALTRGTKVLVVAYVEKDENGKLTIEVAGHKVHGTVAIAPQVADAAADSGDGGSETTPIVDFQETTPIVD